MSTPLCRECSDAAGNHWRRWAELALGDAPTVRAATDQDLRRAIKQLLDAVALPSMNFPAVVLTPEQTRAVEAICGDRDTEITTLRERVANLEHTIRVMAEESYQGDSAAVSMHAEHALGPEPDLSVVRTFLADAPGDDLWDAVLSLECDGCEILHVNGRNVAGMLNRSDFSGLALDITGEGDKRVGQLRVVTP